MVIKYLIKIKWNKQIKMLSENKVNNMKIWKISMMMKQKFQMMKMWNQRKIYKMKIIFNIILKQIIIIMLIIMIIQKKEQLSHLIYKFKII